MDEVVRIDNQEISYEKLETQGVRTIKNRTILAPGVWNGIKYTPEKIIRAFHNTDWEGSYASSLVADHRDDEELTKDNKLYQPEGRPLTLRDWLGYVSNPRVIDDPYSKEYGFIKGDLNLCDSELSMKLIEGNAPFGISVFAQFFGEKDEQGNRDFKIMNNAIVVKPACKESYINKKLSDDELNVKLEDISAFERIRKRLGKSLNEFYAVPKDPPSMSKLPIFDNTHTRNAMARFNQTQFDSEDEKAKAKSKIMSAAKMFGIEVNNFDKLEETTMDDMMGKKIESHGLQPIKTKKKKKKSNSTTKRGELIEMKGGQMNNKMENKKLEEEKIESINDVDKLSKTAEEISEFKEESEEELMGKLAEITEKIMRKKKMTPEQAKMQKLESEISSLKEMITKLSESKVEVQSTEKLSAKPRTIASTIQKEESFRIFGKSASNGSAELASMLGY